ncbi:3-hydroxy-2-methylbutyryl-CoA dehydrogenase [Thalassospira profundimaris]|uniref:3-hydroxy-2-methylbutyryl-CoA dehydrogenase n=1 Tax=Thalassospira profundimaris TaxID=502049 RepID=A0A367WYK3_9PROT|nr:SDR family NAD(P)-dependent oxidoreductase [Thalassospira profundimaris]RCK46523.1 3-hydroxy-2-methylbutyryl-CoA dehydrogenase [Thalassospira profundimaris]
MHLDQISAVVTGGGSGLGAATARKFAASGAKVAVLDRNGETANRIANDIDGIAITVDMADPQSVAAAFTTIRNKIGIPRILVNCAGIGTASRILPRSGDLPIEGFIKTLNINLTGSFVAMSHAAKLMAEAAPLNEDGERGVIINTSSVGYEDGQIGQCAYAASKGGIAAMTLPAARELARIGVRVVAIAPGLFATAMTDTLPDEARAAIAANIPFPKRLGHASEYADLACHIVENTMLNGTVIRLDGAVRLQAR